MRDVGAIGLVIAPEAKVVAERRAGRSNRARNVRGMLCGFVVRKCV